MKLLLDLQGLQSSSRYRGIGRLTGALATAIVEQAAHRHDVHVLLNEGLMDDLPPAADVILRRLPRSNVHGFGPFPDVAEQSPANRWRAGSAALVREALISRLRPDVVHLSSLFEGYVDGAVTSVGRLEAPHATAVTLYDLIPLAMPELYLADPTYRRFYLQRVQDLKRADRLLSISEVSGREAEMRLHVPADRISVIGAGVSKEFRPRRPGRVAEADLRGRLGLSRTVILHVGAVDPRKNVGLLVDAFAQLPRELAAERQLVFVGPIAEDERERIVAHGSRAGLPSDGIVVAGHVAQDDLLDLYGITEALVFPSVNEGFGLPPLEAMACGVPVLAADATSLPEVVGRSDCLFDPTDARQLALRLERLLTQEAWRAELRASGLSRAATFGWDRVGERALAALERTGEEHADRRRAAAPLRRRPRMAFVSPLPPEQTGIADYSAELLRELLVFYDIDCIHPDQSTSDGWIAANCRLRSVEWFSAHAGQYDRILYSIGNSTFHTHMFDLLVRCPGTVILHDAFLSDLAFHLDAGATTGRVPREIYRSHGLTGLRLLRDEGAVEAIRTLTMSGAVFRNAQAVIVHSRHAAELASEAFGADAVRDVAVVPQLRSLPIRPDRAAARRELGLSPDAFVVCSFGIIHPNKSNRRLASAFLSSALARDPSCLLLFVGQDIVSYGEEIVDDVVRPAGAEEAVRFVGRVDDARYGLYLAAADMAVQLRTESRGETSRAVLDAMAHGLPTIVSDLGSAAELPDAAVVKVPVGTDPEVLAAALDRLWLDRAYRTRMGERARDEIARCHHPVAIAREIRDVVDRAATTAERVASSALLEALSDLPIAEVPGRDDLVALARHVETVSPPRRLRQILCDVSVLADEDARTGIQRVVRAVLDRLISNPPVGYRIEPVVMGEAGYLHARRFVAERLWLSTGQDFDEPVAFGPGDHFLGLDWVPDRLPRLAGWLERFRRAGGTVTFVVYDLLPLLHPRFFPDWLQEMDERWFATVLGSADRLACISAAVGDSVARLAPASWPAGRRTPLPVGYFHLGHDLAASLPTTGTPDEADAILARLRARPTFLMVGTVEPRKGHAQVIAAFELLWAEGLDVGLCIVGKEGWMVEEIATAIRTSHQRDHKLLWLPRASDEWLGQVYRNAAALVAASVGEGFGLPLIEAAGHGIPVIARDIDVFREVGGSHAFYFEGEEPGDLADAIRAWLELWVRGEAPRSTDMRRLTWEEATADLTAIMFGERSYRVLESAIPAAEHPHDRPE